MGTDTIKAFYANTIAAGVIFGGLAIIYLTRLDPPESDVAGLRLLLAGFIGGAMGWVFNRETQTGIGRMVERATAAGAASAPTVTATGGPPAGVSVTPSPTPPVD